MGLRAFLQEEKGEILSRWLDRVLSTYPEDAARVFKRVKDPFANPVGHAADNALATLYTLLLDHDQPDLTGIDAALDQFVKMRAVQAFAPSTAVAFIFDLKGVVADYLRERKVEMPLAEWQLFDNLLDHVAGRVFDLYLACRERLYQARVQEIKSRNHLVTEGGCCPSAALRRSQEKGKIIALARGEEVPDPSQGGG